MYLTKSKAEILALIIEFYKMAKNQFDVNINCFKIDNGREFMNSMIVTYVKAEIILHKSLCVNTPQRNGLAERKIGYILATTKSLLYHVDMTLYCWGEATFTVFHLINILQSKTTRNKSLSKLICQHFVGARVGSHLL